MEDRAMTPATADRRKDDSSNEPSSYEPPKIERVLTADDLTREVQYGGAPSFDTVVG
jgi:hypothetical protein